MAESFAQRMVTKYETLLEANAGLASVSVDGQTVTYTKLQADYQYWLKRLAVSKGLAPVVSRVKLDNF